MHLLPPPSVHCCRFERPDSRNRWDSPLFMVQPLLGEAALQEVAATAAAAVADGPPPARRAAAGAADNAGAAPAAAAAAARAAGGLDAAAAAAAAAAGLPPEEAMVEEGPALVLRAKELRPHLATDTSHYKLACELHRFAIKAGKSAMSGWRSGEEGCVAPLLSSNANFLPHQCTLLYPRLPCELQPPTCSMT